MKHRAVRTVVCAVGVVVTGVALALLSARALAQTPTEPASADEKGLTVRSVDRTFVFRIKGLMQVDGRWFLGDAALDDRDTYLVRRARPILDATLLGMVDVRFVPDFGEGRAQVFDAYIELRPRPWFRVRVGKFKPPLGLERLQSDQDMPVLERALTSNLSPSRDVGALLSGEILAGTISYAIGMFDGAPDNGTADVDSNHAKDLAARLFLHPFAVLPRLGVFGLGLAASSGNQRGAAAAPGLPTFRTAGQNAFFNYLQSTDDPAQTVVPYQRRDRLNPQLYYFLGGFGLLAEHITSRQRVRKAGDSADLTHAAWHATASVALGGRSSFEGVFPTRPFDPAAGSLGALELAVRLSQLTLDAATFPRFAAPEIPHQARALALTLNWYLGRNARLGLQFDTTTFMGGEMAPRTQERALVARTQAAF